MWAAGRLAQAFPLAAVILVVACGRGPVEQDVMGPQPVELQEYPFGGDFTLTSHEGRQRSLSDERGKVVLLFFGYTTCPDACPLTMSKIADALDRVDEARDQVVVFFVTVDVERDTPEALARYVNSFDVPMVGLTGTRAEIDAVIAQYRGAYEITPSDSVAGPEVGHTTYTYLIDRDGAVRYLFSFDDPASSFAEGMALALDLEPRESVASPAEEVAVEGAPPSGDLAVERGRTIFNGDRGLCYTCHRRDLGGLVGPNLVDDYWVAGCSVEDVARSTEVGFPDRGMMPFGSGTALTREELEQVARYILSMRGSSPADPKPPDLTRESPCPP